MKTLQLASVFLLHAALAQGIQVPTRNIPPGARIHNNEIHWTEPGCDRTQDYPCDEVTRRCYDHQRPALTPDQRYFACCSYGHQLRGSPDTQFHCCPQGHEVAGSSWTGYQCCPAGETFNGRVCERVCRNGRTLVNGECQCPPGTVDAYDGTCESPKTPECGSGLTTGEYCTSSDLIHCILCVSPANTSLPQANATPSRPRTATSLPTTTTASTTPTA